MKSAKHILLVGSDLSVKGGITSVLKNYLSYNNWEEIQIHYVPTHIDATILKKVWFFFRAYLKIRRELASGNIQLAHIHVSERGSFYRKEIIVNLCSNYGIPVFLHHHGAEFDLFYEKASIRQKRRINAILNKVEQNIVLSERLIPVITQKAPNANVLVLPNAVSVDSENHYNINATNILLLGELNQRKGVYVLLDAVSEIDHLLRPETKLYLCGNGNLKQLKQRINELHLEHRIAHIGWIDGGQKAKIFANTAVSVLPSYYEGLPVSILETMGYGIPNISTAIASIPDVICEGKTGMLIKPGDSQSLAEKLLRLIQDTGLRQRISIQSHQLILKEYSLSNYMEHLKALYRSTGNR